MDSLLCNFKLLCKHDSQDSGSDKFTALDGLLGRFLYTCFSYRQNKMRGIQSFGLKRHKGYLTNLIIGLLLGMCIYVLKYFCFYGLGKFTVEGLMPVEYIIPLLSKALIGMLFSSLINDILIRGYWFRYFNENKMTRGFVLATTIIYVLDDSWNEGFHWINLMFSVLLGVSLAYTVYKTGSIWMSIGIHWGGNLIYRTLYGFEGQGVYKLDHVKEGILYDYVSLGVTALLMPTIFLLLRRRNDNTSLSTKQGKARLLV